VARWPVWALLRAHPFLACPPLDLPIPRSFDALVTARPEAVARFPPSSQLAARLRERGITDKAAIDLIEKLLSLDPQKRINASAAALVREGGAGARRSLAAPASAAAARATRAFCMNVNDCEGRAHTAASAGLVRRPLRAPLGAPG
jgi:hypothetical protein